jgi:hypothetical protein
VDPDILLKRGRPGLRAEDQLEGDLVRPFGWSKMEDPFAAGISEVLGAARDRAGARRAGDVDEGSLSGDVTFRQRSDDRAAESCQGGVDQGAAPVRPPDLSGRIAGKEDVLGENVEVAGAWRRGADVDEVVDGSGFGDDVDPQRIRRRSCRRAPGGPGRACRDGRVGQANAQGDRAASNQPTFTHDSLPKPVRAAMASVRSAPYPRPVLCSTHAKCVEMVWR